MSSGGGSFMSLSVYAGTDVLLRCFSYPHSTPILSIGSGGSSLTVSVLGRTASDEAVKFARDLLGCAEQFAAEVERLHAAKTSDSKAAEDTAA